MAARNVKKILKWCGKGELNRLSEVNWTLIKGESGYQQNIDDCGVFTYRNATDIMLGFRPTKTSDVRGFRLKMVTYILGMVKKEIPKWDQFETKAQGVQDSTLKDQGKNNDSPTIVAQLSDTGDDDIRSIDINIVDDAISISASKLEHRCNICYYYYGGSEEAVDVHKRTHHNTDPWICTWPGCDTIVESQESLRDHIYHIYERKMFICLETDYYRRFLTGEETRVHKAESHTNREPEEPNILSPQYRTFNLADLEAFRVKSQKL